MFCCYYMQMLYREQYLHSVANMNRRDILRLY